MSLDIEIIESPPQENSTEISGEIVQSFDGKIYYSDSFDSDLPIKGTPLGATIAATLAALAGLSAVVLFGSCMFTHRSYDMVLCCRSEK